MSGEPATPVASGSVPRLLIVDDEVGHMRALCDVLRGADYDPIGCTSGPDALELLRSQRCELLITDLTMPAMDGITLLREAHALDPDLVGIIMTGQGTIETAVDAMKTGAQDYILKPLELSLVLPVLARALTVRRLRIDNRELLRHLAERTRQLELANSELEAFAYSVSHDLRSPLRVISGFADVLELDFADSLPPDARPMLAQIQAGAKRMDGIIEALLRLSQLGRQPLAKARIDVAQLAQSVVEQLLSAGQPHHPQVRVHPMPAAEADAALLGHVFTNLLSNAFKFTRQVPQPCVDVGCRSDGARAVYYVRDNGLGFDMKQADRLFGAFQRLHARPDIEGTGIGLSIVKRIIERHGGRIWAEAEAGRGACFQFTLSEPG